MMLDSGTTSHLKSLQHKVSNLKSTNVPITVADDSKINGRAEGIRAVHGKRDDGNVSIKLSNTNVVSNLSMSLL